MTLRQLTPPTAAVVSLPDLKKQVRTEYHTDDDAYLLDLATAAVAWIEKVCGLAVAEQEWELSLDNFSDGITIPIAPVISVSAVVYDNAQGDEVPLTGFRAFNEGTSDRAFILPPVGTDWPDTSGEPHAVRVTFTAGFSEVPAQIKHAIRLIVAHWFENRESATEKTLHEVPIGVDALLAPLRNWS